MCQRPLFPLDKARDEGLAFIPCSGTKICDSGQLLQPNGFLKIKTQNHISFWNFLLIFRLDMRIQNASCCRYHHKIPSVYGAHFVSIVLTQ